MNILITNDDGIGSQFMKELALALKEKHNVIVTAPSNQMSACSHSLSIRKKIKVSRSDFDGIEAYSVLGSTADCVKFACMHFSHFKPDFVISGINDGSNAGTDTIYSGTVAGAREGTIMGIKSLAVSKFKACHISHCVSYFAENFEKYIKLNYSDTFYNINFPPFPKEKWIGEIPCFVGKNFFNDKYYEFEDGFILDGDEDITKPNSLKCDVEYLREGYVTISPIQINQQNEKLLFEMKNLLKTKN